MSGTFTRHVLAWAVAACALFMIPAAAFASDELLGGPETGIAMAPDGDEYSSEPGPEDTTMESGDGLWFTSVDGVAIATILLALGLTLGHRRLKRRKPLWRSGRDPPLCALGECHSRERFDTGCFNGHDASPVTAVLASPRLSSLHLHLRVAQSRAAGGAGQNALVIIQGGLQQ